MSLLFISYCNYLSNYPFTLHTSSLGPKVELKINILGASSPSVGKHSELTIIHRQKQAYYQI